MVPTDNNPALVQIMAWCWIGDKPLSEPMLTRYTDAYNEDLTEIYLKYFEYIGGKNQIHWFYSLAIGDAWQDFRGKIITYTQHK